MYELGAKVYNFFVNIHKLIIANDVASDVRAVEQAVMITNDAIDILTDVQDITMVVEIGVEEYLEQYIVGD